MSRTRDLSVLRCWQHVGHGLWLRPQRAKRPRAVLWCQVSSSASRLPGDFLMYSEGPPHKHEVQLADSCSLPLISRPCSPFRFSFFTQGQLPCTDSCLLLVMNTVFFFNYPSCFFVYESRRRCSMSLKDSLIKKRPLQARSTCIIAVFPLQQHPVINTKCKAVFLQHTQRQASQKVILYTTTHRAEDLGYRGRLHCSRDWNFFCQHFLGACKSVPSLSK